MLRELFVSGFKSLKDFDFEIRPGLNVLVGPNGAGKTNLIRFFEFLSYLQRNSLSEAVSKAGGAGEIFTKKGAASIERNIRIRLRGHGKAIESYWPAERRPSDYVIYETELVIHFAEEDNSLYYEHQNISIRTFAKKPSQIRFDDQDWDIQLSQTVSSGLNIKLKKSYKLPPHFDPYIERLRTNFNEKALPEFPIAAYLGGFITQVQLIDRDIASGSTYNIVPSHVRRPEDIAQSPTINSDGTGLAATLYRLQSEQAPSTIYGRRSRHFPEDSFEKIKAFFLLVNPNLRKL